MIVAPSGFAYNERIITASFLSIIMFNFFRRKKNTDPEVQIETQPSESAEPSTSAILVETPAPQIEEPSVVVPAPIESKVPSVESENLGEIFNRALESQLAQIKSEPEIFSSIAPQPETQEKPSAEEFSQRGWMARLRAGLSKTGTNLRHVFVGVRVDEALFESLEDALLMADVGVSATEQIMQSLRAKIKKERIEDAEGVRVALKQVLTELLQPLEKEL